MIYVFKMISGQDVVGRVSSENDFSAGYFEVMDPMEIEKSPEGMKLRDMLMLGTGEKLIFKVPQVITYYRPSDILVAYYNKAVVYSKNFTKPMIEEQIRMASMDLEEAMQEEQSNLTTFLMGASGVKTFH